METEETSTRLRYLNASAYYLASAAPETSRHLMSQCNTLMFDSEIEQTDYRRRQVCGACGTIMTIGWGADVQLTSLRAKQKQKKRKTKPKIEKTLPVWTEDSKEMVYTCGSCTRETRISVNSVKMPKKSVSRAAFATIATKHVPSPAQEVATLPGPPVASASSRKKAKKKNGGLEALLANKKASDARNTCRGLDLMSFMNPT
ncbi:hypothetical protein BJ878DRAFT_35383 [Calycina marina]|uniref:Uncharacterized protein n=1 Tax=Calycina marina TaxID=1763456 RepID=A0A9P7Z488_9HELO|nr:hypothetical protein BJ878DRAFT_35383 [Calycina marina]